MGPFSCFGNSGYIETLPRAYDQQHGTIPSFDPPSSNELLSTAYNNASTPSLLPKQDKRRSVSRKQKRLSTGKMLASPTKQGLTKDLIGKPTDFVHVSGGGHGSSTGGGKMSMEMEETLRQMTEVLSSPLAEVSSNTAPQITQRDDSQSQKHVSNELQVPHTTGINPNRLSYDPLKTKRKPAPEITPSVIKQAGRDAVDASGEIGRNRNFPLPPIPTSPLYTEFISEQDTPVIPFDIELSKPYEQTPYATDTGKIRWDQTMDEIEGALEKAERN